MKSCKSSMHWIVFNNNLCYSMSELYDYNVLCGIWITNLHTVLRSNEMISRATDWKTRPNFSQPSSRIALVYQSFCSHTIADWLLYDWITKKLAEKQPAYHLLELATYAQFLLLSTKFFFCDPVVLESICYPTRAKRLINDGNTTRGLSKIWTGLLAHTDI